MVSYNPHIKHFEGDRRGYFAGTGDGKQMDVALRFVTSVEDPNGAGYHERRFVVENGKPRRPRRLSSARQIMPA